MENKLLAIRTKRRNSWVTGVQFVFESGEESPVFNSRGAGREELETMQVDTELIVNRVSILEHENGRIYDLKLDYYSQGSSLYEPEADSGLTWRSLDIPYGQYIIGLRCNTDSSYMQMLDLILGGTQWEPRVEGFVEFGQPAVPRYENDNKFRPWYQEYPNLQELNQFPVYVDWSLTEIRYKQFSNKYGLEGL